MTTPADIIPLKRDTTLRPERGVLRFMTAGDVDDGKSTLIGRLLYETGAVYGDQLAAIERASQRRGITHLDLSLLTDGLEAEREQGITIDVAYRYFTRGERKYIIADAPGHEEYTRNMATAASRADAAVILVDVTKGVTRQTARHFYLARLLGVRHFIVAVNKMDLVGYSRQAFNDRAAEVAALARKLGLAEAISVPVSALDGEHVVGRRGAMPWYEGPTVLEALERLDPVHDRDGQALRFFVQLVGRPVHKGQGRRLMGRVESGTVAPGMEVRIYPSGRAARIRAVLGLNGALDRADAGEAVTLIMSEELDISRGSLITPPEAPPTVNTVVQATVCWFDREPLRTGAPYLLKLGTRTVKARVLEIESRLDIDTLMDMPAAETLQANDVARVTLLAQEPLAFDPYAIHRGTGSFILIDEWSTRTCAAGMLHPASERRA
ncbi:sulfate adenylyltransferase subunit 1 [Pelomicrobium methylotrophicum]|uniref:sulfate adenylyltransferase n=1 Tax=Pelomicrobium methylotrophicum TaxID=2602750 RepID=A0A5C7EQQ9_9PROT|nr:GTP-binding protein [Pelomicrobium methylotrophicum]TXF10905.1 sulfate adenylyltransferase [Pelomicrobium methylotrophicum]